MNQKPKVYFCDIDGTICHTPNNNGKWDYTQSTPKQDFIDKLNEKYAEGHKIVISTARGGTSGINWYDLTKKQLKQWGVKYHELIMGKYPFDVIIDDKAMRPDEFLKV